MELAIEVLRSRLSDTKEYAEGLEREAKLAEDEAAKCRATAVTRRELITQIEHAIAKLEAGASQ